MRRTSAPVSSASAMTSSTGSTASRDGRHPLSRIACGQPDGIPRLRVRLRPQFIDECAHLRERGFDHDSTVIDHDSDVSGTRHPRPIRSDHGTDHITSSEHRCRRRAPHGTAHPRRDRRRIRRSARWTYRSVGRRRDRPGPPLRGAGPRRTGTASPHSARTRISTSSRTSPVRGRGSSTSPSTSRCAAMSSTTSSRTPGPPWSSRMQRSRST